MCGRSVEELSISDNELASEMFLSGEIDKSKASVSFPEDVSASWKAEVWTVRLLKVVVNVLLTTLRVCTALKVQHWLQEAGGSKGRVHARPA